MRLKIVLPSLFYLPIGAYQLTGDQLERFKFLANKVAERKLLELEKSKNNNLRNNFIQESQSEILKSPRASKVSSSSQVDKDYDKEHTLSPFSWVRPQIIEGKEVQPHLSLSDELSRITNTLDDLEILLENSFPEALTTVSTTLISLPEEITTMPWRFSTVQPTVPSKIPKNRMRASYSGLSSDDRKAILSGADNSNNNIINIDDRQEITWLDPNLSTKRNRDKGKILDQVITKINDMDKNYKNLNDDNRKLADQAAHIDERLGRFVKTFQLIGKKFNGLEERMAEHERLLSKVL